MSELSSAVGPSLRLRIAVFTISLVITGIVAELIVRRLDGNAFPRLRMFELERDGSITLEPNATSRLIASRGAVCEIATGTYGVRTHRAGEPAGPRGAWLVVGDSQVLGFGVADSETFAARATAAGVPMVNAGVPGYGVEDALHRAAELLDPLRPRGVIVVVNQANDWEEIRQPAQSRFRVRGGWLLQASTADGWKAHYLASPLSRFHLFYYAMQPLFSGGPVGFAAASSAPEWLIAPQLQSAATRDMADAVHAFARQHPGVEVVVAFLPVDCATSPTRAARSPFAPLLGGRAPWRDRTLSEQLRASLAATPMIDLMPVLGRADEFLDGDYHLSPGGHQAVAQALVTFLQKKEWR
jgi:lysophospholipase L1-like esterase